MNLWTIHTSAECVYQKAKKEATPSLHFLFCNLNTSSGSLVQHMEFQDTLVIVVIISMLVKFH